MSASPVQSVSPGLWQLERPHASGWGLNMILVGLPGGGLCLYSPTWVGEDTFARVEALGEPRILCAPNSFHHLSLARFRQRYPRALAVAAPGAEPRLRRHGHEGLRPLDEAAPLLPAGARWLVLAGSRAGEAWLALPGATGTTWIVCDGFFHVTRPLRGAIGLVLRALRSGPGLAIGQTFLWVALRDRRAYRAWLDEALAHDRPVRLLFSHGEPLESPDLASTLGALAARRV